MDDDYKARRFNRWATRYSGNQFPYVCECGVSTNIKSRRVQARRSCSGCGLMITVAAIDEQTADLERAEREREERRAIREEANRKWNQKLTTVLALVFGGIMMFSFLMCGLLMKISPSTKSAPIKVSIPTNKR